MMHNDGILRISRKRLVDDSKLRISMENRLSVLDPLCLHRFSVILAGICAKHRSFLCFHNFGMEGDRKVSDITFEREQFSLSNAYPPLGKALGQAIAKPFCEIDFSEKLIGQMLTNQIWTHIH